MASRKWTISLSPELNISGVSHGLVESLLSAGQTGTESDKDQREEFDL